MASDCYIYSLFELHDSNHLLIRVLRPGYSNAKQNDADLAESIAERKTTRILEHFLESYGNPSQSPKLLGEFQGLPEGDALYDENGTILTENLWYTQTTFGHPWIYLSLAAHEEDFWTATNEEDFADNGYSRENLLSPALHIKSVTFVTENDYDLSGIPLYNVNNIE